MNIIINIFIILFIMELQIAFILYKLYLKE